MQFFFFLSTVGTRCQPTSDPRKMKLERHTMSIFTILFVVLLVAWLLGLSVFHVTGGLIHILLIVAVISLILHFVRGRRGIA